MVDISFDVVFLNTLLYVMPTGSVENNVIHSCGPLLLLSLFL